MTCRKEAVCAAGLVEVLDELLEAGGVQQQEEEERGGGAFLYSYFSDQGSFEQTNR